jgi:PAS domain-containing protein
MNWFLNKLTTIEGALAAFATLVGLFAGFIGLLPTMRRYFRRGYRSVVTNANIVDELAAIRAENADLKKEMAAGFERVEEGQLHQIAIRHAMANAYEEAIIFHTDSRGAFQWVSKPWFRFTGMECNAARGRGWEMALPEDDRPRVLLSWQMAVDHEREFEGQFSLLNKFTHVRTLFHVTAEPIWNKQGKIIDYLGVMTKAGTVINTSLAAPEPK